MKIIVDLEATCCEHEQFPRSEMEIIEIGACALDDVGEVVSEFQSFVRPVRNPTLTNFCKTLTSITQDQVDAAPDFPKVLDAFTGWLGQYRAPLFCSWGEYDAKQLRQDCRFHEVAFPFDDPHVNLKAEFSKVLGTRKRFEVGQALRKSGLEFMGTPHRGIDDARNIARLATVIDSKMTLSADFQGSSLPESVPIHLPVLYRDDRFIAIHKPSGLLVHRTPIDKRETLFAIQLLRDQIGQQVTPCHRLDRPTSGVLLFAFDPEALSALSIAFQEKQVKKTYQAIVRGFAPETGVIEHPLRKFEDNDARIKSDTTQDARTVFTRLSKTELPIPIHHYAATRYSLVELYPETGRRHQLRRHLAHINCPIIGDTRYGDSLHNIAFRRRYGIQRLFLAATQVTFQHPFSREMIEIEAPLASDFQAALEKTNLWAPE